VGLWKPRETAAESAPQAGPGDVIDAIKQACIGHGPIVAAASDTACPREAGPRFMMAL